MLQAVHVAADSPITSPESSLGVRRALMESTLRLSCRDSVLADASISLGTVPDEHAHAYCLTTELYGNTRMLLACLTESELAEVMFCRPLMLIGPVI